MSLKLIVRIMYEVELPRPQQLVLERMAENAHDDGTGARPSVDHIAWKAGYKPRQVINIMRQLEDAKILVKTRSAAQHRAAEYRIDLSAAPEKMPFKEWRALYGRYKGEAPHAEEDAEESSGAISARLDDADEEASDVQFENPDVQSRVSGVQFENSGVQPIAPEPLENEPVDNESLDEPPRARTKGGRKDRSKPAPPDYRSKVDTFLAEHEDLAEELQEFISRAAARNDSGEMTYGRQWRGFCLPVDLSLKDGSSKDAVLYALQVANEAGARDMRYFERVLENNPDGRPRQRSASTNGTTPPPLVGDESEARRKEGYEWLFEKTGAPVDRQTPPDERESLSEAKEAEIEYMRRVKVIETHMRDWRATKDDRGYQRQVFLLRNRAEENGIMPDDVERLDEQIRAEHAEKAVG